MLYQGSTGQEKDAKVQTYAQLHEKDPSFLQKEVCTQIKIVHESAEIYERPEGLQKVYSSQSSEARDERYPRLNGENPPSRTSTKEMGTFQKDYEESFTDLKGSEALLKK